MDCQENPIFFWKSPVGEPYVRPFLPLLTAMMTGICAGSFRPELLIPAVALLVFCFIFLIRLAFSGRDAAASPLILFFLLGYLSIANILEGSLPRHHIRNFTDTGWYRIRGEIATVPVSVPGRGRFRFVMAVSNLERGESVIPVVGKIRVTVSGAEISFLKGAGSSKGGAFSKSAGLFQSADLFQGDKIRFPAKIRGMRNFGNPGAFDYRRYMAFKGIRGASSVRAKKIILEERGGGPGAIERFRQKITLLIDESKGSEIAKAVLKALVVGDRSGITPDTRQLFNRAGTGHLLAISGLHMGVVGAAAFFIARLLFSRIDFFLWRAWRDKGAALLAVIPVLGYAVLSGMSPSTQRAAVMVSVFLLARFLQRETDPVNTLAVAAFLILSVSPGSLFSISFQLSFTAVLGIILVMEKITIKGRGKWGRALAGVARFTLVSFSAIIATTPLVMRCFNQVSLVGIPANLLCVPLVGSVVVPLGLASVAVGTISPWIASFGFSICCAILSFSLEIIRFFSGLSFAAITTVTPSSLEIVLVYLVLGTILFFSKKNDAFRKYGKIALFTLVCAWTLDLGYWTCRRFRGKDLRVTVIDVGQGVASLVEFPGGQCMLIDGGGFYDNSIFDVGRSVIAPFLLGKKIRTVETIVLSHPQSDHLNGLTHIAENFNVKRVWSNSQPSDTVGYGKFIGVLQNNGIEAVPFGTLMRDHMINGVRVRIFYPPRDFMEVNKKKGKKADYNNNSLVIRLAMGRRSFLFPGDIMEEGEKMLVSTSGPDLTSTVLIAPHHGSKTSSTEAFMDRVRPEITVIPLGWKNRFGFPASEVLDRYRKIGSLVYRTDTHGAVTMTTDGSALSIKTHGHH